MGPWKKHHQFYLYKVALKINILHCNSWVNLTSKVFLSFLIGRNATKYETFFILKMYLLVITVLQKKAKKINLVFDILNENCFCIYHG